MMTRTIPNMSFYVICLIFVLDIISDAKCQNLDPLTFQYDKSNGRIVTIRPKTEFSIQMIEFRMVSKDKYGTKIYNAPWKDMLPINLANLIGPYNWQKPDGICAEYEIRTTFTDNRTITQDLRIPALELSQSSKLRMTSIQYQPDGDITVSVSYGTDMEYWTGAGARFVSIDTVMNPIHNCQTIYQSYPPPVQILNGGHQLVFNVQYAYSNCTFTFGLNISLNISDENCVQNLTTNQTESLTFSLNCSTVPNLRCPIPKRDCAADCSPLEIKSTKVTEPRNRTSIKNEENLSISWTFPERTERSIDHYRVHYSLVNLSNWNTVFSEKENVTIESLKNKFVEIHPNESGNYTFQICAILTSACQYPIDWSKEKKYKIEFNKEISKPAAVPFRDRGNGQKMNNEINLTLFLVAYVLHLICTYRI